jgi:hypothetical protein
MAVYPYKVTRCLKGHQLYIRNGLDYFCKKCGNIDINDLRLQISKYIFRVRSLKRRGIKIKKLRVKNNG